MVNELTDNTIMNKVDKIYSELRQIRKLLSELIGTTDKPANEKFSKEAMSKARKQFRKLSIERGEWVPTYDINRVIKHAPYNNAKIIIEQFQFKNYFKRGNTYYFKKKDLIALDKELKKRKINLSKYDELIKDKEKFQKYINSLLLSEGYKTRRRYKIPEGLRDIFSKYWVSL